MRHGVLDPEALHDLCRLTGLDPATVKYVKLINWDPLSRRAWFVELEIHGLKWLGEVKLDMPFYRIFPAESSEPPLPFTMNGQYYGDYIANLNLEQTNGHLTG